MRACLELLTEGSIDLPAAEVAARSGVNRTTVYRWWPTPADLLQDALEFHARHRTDAPDTGTWEGDVRSMITELASLAADPAERGIMLAMLSGRYPEVNDAMMGWYWNDLPHWFAMVGRAVGRGEVDPEAKPAMVLHMMLAPAVAVSLFEDRALTDDEIESLVSMVCRATAPEPTAVARKGRAGSSSSAKRPVKKAPARSTSPSR